MTSGTFCRLFPARPGDDLPSGQYDFFRPLGGRDLGETFEILVTQLLESNPSRVEITGLKMGGKVCLGVQAGSAEGVWRRPSQPVFPALGRLSRVQTLDSVLLV